MVQQYSARLVPSFTRLLTISSVIRVLLILYNEWHDQYSVVKYTDVDYRVFSDASHFLLNPSKENNAQGPLGSLALLGDPYTRATYRYTPLLAVLLIPNEWLHPSFGKYMFAAADVLGGMLMYKLLTSVILPGATSEPTVQQKHSLRAKDKSDVGHQDDGWTTERYATALVASHLLNPLVFTISTRGSSESVLSLFVLSTLYCALRGRWTAAAVLLGLSTHWKIYPFVYGVACLGVVSGRASRNAQGGHWLDVLVNVQTLRFTTLSAATFVALGALMYAIWGYPFLHESYLYHIHRLDHRHNFSPYFYLIYLTYPSATTDLLDMPLWRRLLRSPLTSFVPQMVLSLGAGLLFGRRRDNLVFAWFVQTVVFVVFNKVCTSQYFLWYMLFLPLLIPRLRLSRRQLLTYIAVWVGTQALWLSEAYKLEFLGESVFFPLWVRSLVYVVGNCWVLAKIMGCYTP